MEIFYLIRRYQRKKKERKKSRQRDLTPSVLAAHRAVGELSEKLKEKKTENTDLS